MYRPGAISMKVEWVQGAPSNFHTQLHTQVLGSLCGGGQGLPSTIIFPLSLLLPATVMWAAFYSPWGKGLIENILCPELIVLEERFLMILSNIGSLLISLDTHFKLFPFFINFKLLSSVCHLWHVIKAKSFIWHIENFQI